ncbi:ubiquinol oxidase subunit II [Parabacteroides sp. FAFU027]|uniref:ubiquinol oxidase subunit II n=1 Tax=Parabacteroides sp. FAFU027 TaxID=2922715 RepID=UPI001FAEA373|nr:ubiquinol oxidase subunit II [Parabacteroides sp. FAFU027]
MSEKKISNGIKGGVFLLLTLMLSSCKDMVILDPKGPIGHSNANLIITAVALMLIVVVPVFIMVMWFSIRYRRGNEKATFRPEWGHSYTAEWVIWSVPIAIIAVLSYLTWTSTHALDPYKPIQSEKKALQVEVISTDWNWVFIYPEDSVATINELVIEAGRPVSFRLTSASVMTSFFIPQLGSQIYAMAGMQTKLNLLADHVGTYTGQNQEFSGDGYDNMHFNVYAKSPEDFKQWLGTVKGKVNRLTNEDFIKITQYGQEYQLAKKSDHHLAYKPIAPCVYYPVEPGIFDKTMAPYMDWMNMEEGSTNSGESMDINKKECSEHMDKTMAQGDCCKHKNNNNK